MTMGKDATQRYKEWLEDPRLDPELREELEAIADQPKEIEDRFYRDLEFGTGGLRGVIGAGTNRMNRYTVGKASQGLAEYVLSHGKAGASIAIAYDSRHKSSEFALEAALVFAGNGIRAYLFETLRPTPELSFTVRELKAAAGVVITASHNPPEYNGYKVYGADGGQLVPDEAERVTRYIGKIGSFRDIRKISREEAEGAGLLHWIGEEIDRRFIQAVTSVSPRPGIVRSLSRPLRVTYTPLHGAGNLPVREALRQIGFTDVRVVPEQELPDPQFSTVKSPNPEEREAFTLALEMAKSDQAELLIGTDPDCDRMGAVVRGKDGTYEILTGNQTGALLVYYLLSSLKEQDRLPGHGVVIKTIVTSEMGAAIARSFGMETMDTLTGFKYIGEKMTQFEREGGRTFVFGYEESYGYLAGNYCRDKDAVLASMLICEAAAYYKTQGKTLLDVLEELYREYGYYREQLKSLTLKGREGLEKIRQIMEQWRTHPPKEAAGIAISEVEDYSLGIRGLPKENVLKYKLEDHSWFCMRPSGTEPKLKIYFGVKGTSGKQADSRLQKLVGHVMAKLQE
jgi:phosphoglucomutase